MIFSKLNQFLRTQWRRAIAQIVHWQQHPKRSLPALSAALAALLLIDIGFILMRTSVPSASVVQAIAPRAAATRIQNPIAILSKSPKVTSTVVALRKTEPTTVPTAFPTAAIQAPITKAQLAQANFEPTPSSCELPTGQLLTITVASKIVQANLPVHVYLPPCYRRDRVYPTLYLIQGSNHEFGGWVDFGVPRVADMQMSLGMLPPFIIIMPASGQRANDVYARSLSGVGSWEDFFINELVPYIDKTFNTWKSREGRAVGGISRGGYWSIEIAFAHPDKFSVLGGHSPSITDKLFGVPANFSMLSWAKSVDDLRSMRIWLDAGQNDWAQGDIKKLAGDLDRVKIGYQYSVGAGGHEDNYWTGRVAEYLAFYAATWPRIAKDNASTAETPLAGSAP
jgi:enterochelin esterase-like enzyme